MQRCAYSLSPTVGGDARLSLDHGAGERVGHIFIGNVAMIFDQATGAIETVDHTQLELVWRAGTRLLQLAYSRLSGLDRAVVADTAKWVVGIADSFHVVVR